MVNSDDIARGVFIRPPEEVLKIVRCLNCRHWDKSWCDKNSGGYGYCGELDMMTSREWWCGSGKEKKDER